MRLWVDTDIGTNPDDAVALAAACASPGVELAGVSTVSGDVRDRAAFAAGLLAAAGRTEVLVLAGPAGDELARAWADHAVDAVLAIGPLTNLAAAVAATHAAHLPALTVMGGVLRPVRHRGRIVDIDTNLGTDPAATVVVLGAWPEPTLVPLDATVTMRVDRATEIAVGALPVVGPHLDAWLADRRAAGEADDDVVLVLHDPLALLVAAGDPAAPTRPGVVRVGPDGRVAAVAPGTTGARPVRIADRPADPATLVAEVVGRAAYALRTAGPGATGEVP